MLSVAIYIRVSTTHQVEDGTSLENQRKILSEYCERNNYSLNGIYEDAGKSGKDTKGRNSFLNLMDDVKLNKYDLVIVWKISRFGRNLSDLLYASSLLKC